MDRAGFGPGAIPFENNILLSVLLVFRAFYTKSVLFKQNRYFLYQVPNVFFWYKAYSSGVKRTILVQNALNI